MHSLSEIINWIVETVGMLGYAGIVIMMFLESSFVPFPSEVVMIPAGYLAFKGEMNLMIAILCGIVGSLSGALFNYYLAIKLGRPLLIRYGTYVMFNEDTLSRMENFFNRHGHISTFIGRLIPVIRQYISLPAGLANMNLVIFSLYTSLGAGIWVIILALLGYYIGENEVLIKAYLHNIIVVLLLFCIMGAMLYYWRYQKKQKRF